ncbi:MAG: TM2 domain-containing protein [Candidatus Magnetominusculus sp. LBB02]|nr:TM2 domain-containing protein [Candidatus Magnetominusculus sp. LBB02]
MSIGKTMAGESSKSRTIALVLCFLTGWMGGHRFYCNKVGTGVVMMLTMGGFGLWYFVDLVMISLGSFKDKDDLPISKW